jgi:hypothetical protein
MKKIVLSILSVGILVGGYLYKKTNGFEKDKVIVMGMIYGGKFISPEGSSILEHYCFGDGDTLFLDPSYLKTSPVILREMEGMKEGQDKRIVFKQKEDWRLSYALNPFHIKKENGKFKIYQYIKFSDRKDIYTEINLGPAKIRVNDGMVHTYDCKPYVAYCEI